MKHPGKLIAAAALTALTFTACQKDTRQAPVNDVTTSDAITTETDRSDHDHDKDGYVYTLSNSASGNKVIVYSRSHNGHLHYEAAYSTGGNGTGAGLGSQGALAMTDDKDMLLAVNAGSNTISSLKISGDHLNLISVIHSGGTTPISVTQHNRLVYVVNTGGNGNIAGFTMGNNGRLFELPYSKRPLTSATAGPAQISFVNDGKDLVVTEKNENKIISFDLNFFGLPGSMHSITSANPTPFGFAVGSNGKIVVSEAAGGTAGLSTVSTYRVQLNGNINLIEGPIAANQTAACWVVLTDDERFSYAANTGSASVTSFKITNNGHIDLLRAVAGSTGTTPTDAALSNHSKYLYILNAGGLSISGYQVNDNGSLTNVETESGLSTGVVGLVAE